jgi:hypothetical protein
MPASNSQSKLKYTDEQLLEKIRQLGEKLGRPPLRKEFVAEYDGMYISPITRRWKGFLNARRIVFPGAPLTRNFDLRVEPEEHLKKLRNYYAKYGRIPFGRDFESPELPSKSSLSGIFGSVNNARIAAGLSALIPRNNHGTPKEVTAEEYALYRKNDPSMLSRSQQRYRHLQRRKKGIR